jgi:WD40 repeat protein
VLVWDVSRPALPDLVANLSGPDEGVSSVAFSRDSRTIAAGGHDRTVWLWDIDDPSDPHTIGQLTYHTDTVNVVAFGNDSLLVSASSDNTAMLWDTDVARVRQRICEIQGINRAMDPQGWRRYLPRMESRQLCDR